MEERNEAVGAIFLEIVDNQINDKTPPITGKTYRRLLKKGYSDEDARKMIGAVLATTMRDILKNKQEYDEKRYAKDLKRLPKMPWD